MEHFIKFSHQSLWSTYRFVPSSEPKQPIRLFAAALGQYGQGFGHGNPLSEAETNLREGGRIPGGGQPLEITAVAWDLWGCERDRRHLYDTGTWSWDFAHTLLSGSPLSGLCPVNGGVAMDISDGHLRSYIEYPAGALSIPGAATFNISLRFKDEYKFKDECFARFFIYGKLLNAIEVA
jgi:hypothetical protein